MNVIYLIFCRCACLSPHAWCLSCSANYCVFCLHNPQQAACMPTYGGCPQWEGLTKKEYKLQLFLKMKIIHCVPVGGGDVCERACSGKKREKQERNTIVTSGAELWGSFEGTPIPGEDREPAGCIVHYTHGFGQVMSFSEYLFCPLYNKVIGLNLCFSTYSLQESIRGKCRVSMAHSSVNSWGCVCG